jgi:hypothetical protein
LPIFGFEWHSPSGALDFHFDHVVPFSKRGVIVLRADWNQNLRAKAAAAN